MTNIEAIGGDDPQGMTGVRAKFVVTSQQPMVRPAPGAVWDSVRQSYSAHVQDGILVHMTAVYGGTGADGKNACVENHIFGKGPPFGVIQLHLRDPAIIAALPVGKVFYCDLTPAE